jgi:hypothetical protein
MAVAPALPLHAAGKYVAGAYIVFLALVLVYVAIMAMRLARTERELAELRRDVELSRRQAAGDCEDPDGSGRSGRSDRSGRDRERVA